MEKRCDNCGWSGQVCNGCFRKERLDNWCPKLPTKTKNLTWMEAKEAWDAGWEINFMDESMVQNTHFPLSFGPNASWTVVGICEYKYQLTGKRRK